MNKTISAAVLLVLIALYLFGLPQVVKWWAQMRMPWLPFAGHTGILLYLRMSISYVIAVLSLAVFIGAGIALRFPQQPFRFGLLVGVLPALSILRLPLTHELTRMMQLMVVKDAAIILLMPALLAWLLTPLFARLRRSIATRPVDQAAGG